MRIAWIAGALLVVACATPGRWFKPGGATPDEWHRAEGKCRAQATAATGTCAGWGCAQRVYEACLAGEGWYYDPRP